MPDEFKLRPVETDSCNIHDVDDYNDYHEQGARALAAAILKELGAIVAVRGGERDGIYCNGWDDGYRASDNDIRELIHRLVPPKEKA